MNDKKTSLKTKIVALFLLLAMSVGMFSSMGKEASAATGWTVTFTYYNGQSNETRKNVPNGSYISLPTPTATPTATFLGWKCGSTVYPTNKTVKVTGNMNFVGVWQVVVNFYDYTGRQIDQRTEKTGYAYSFPTQPTRAGYAFTGWFSGGQKVDGTIVTKAFKHDVTAVFHTPITASAQIDRTLFGLYDPGYYEGGTYHSKMFNVSYSFNGKSGANWGYVRQCKNLTPTACGMCTICALANLLNRASVLYYGECRFNFENSVISKIYGTNAFKETERGKYEGKYSYKLPHNDNENKENTFTGTKNTSLTLKTEYKSSGITADDLKNLLAKNPEGVVIWANFGKDSKGNNQIHACVITKYENGNFYAIDTGDGLYNYNSNRAFSSSHFCTGYTVKGVTNALKCVRRVWYVAK